MSWPRTNPASVRADPGSRAVAGRDRTRSPGGWRPPIRRVHLVPNPTGPDSRPGSNAAIEAARHQNHRQGRRARPCLPPDLPAAGGHDAGPDGRGQRGRDHGRGRGEPVPAGPWAWAHDLPVRRSAARPFHTGGRPGPGRHGLPRGVPPVGYRAGRRVRRGISCAPRTGR